MRSAAIALFVVTALSAHAQPVVLSIVGIDRGGTGANGTAVGWSLTRRVTDVKISAFLVNGGGYAGGTAYLMMRIGPDTSRTDEIASTHFELPEHFSGLFTLFTELDLPPGDYWLVFGTPREGRRYSYVNWILSSPLELRTIAGARYLGTTHVELGGLADYAPASRFIPVYDSVGYQIVIKGHDVDPDPIDWRR